MKNEGPKNVPALTSMLAWSSSPSASRSSLAFDLTHALYFYLALVIHVRLVCSVPFHCAVCPSVCSSLVLLRPVHPFHSYWVALPCILCSTCILFLGLVDFDTHRTLSMFILTLCFLHHVRLLCVCVCVCDSGYNATTACHIH
jgi:hypothetical protein